MTNNALLKYLQIPTNNKIITWYKKKIRLNFIQIQTILINRMTSITIPNNPPKILKRIAKTMLLSKKKTASYL